MKVAIIITHDNRRKQLLHTLKSISETAHRNYEIIVLNNDEEPLVIPEFMGNHRIIVDVPKDRRYNDSCVNKNKGIAIALDIKADVMILQHAECAHIGDIVTYASEYTTEYNIVSFQCYSLSERTTEKYHNGEATQAILSTPATGEASNGWRKDVRDYCIAIKAENIKQLNGYDERYRDGHRYSDKDLFERAKRYGLSTYTPHHPYVLHQWHYNGKLCDELPLIEANAEQYKISDLKNYRAKHEITLDL